MQIRLEGDGTVPVYRQIVERVKDEVALGKLTAGERLPTVRLLAQELKVDRNTVVRAYRILDRDGVISLQHGRGTFVRAHTQHPDLRHLREERLELLLGEAIARSLSLGYMPVEIERAFLKRMTEWQRARKKVAPEARGKRRSNGKGRQ